MNLNIVRLSIFFCYRIYVSYLVLVIYICLFLMQVIVSKKDKFGIEGIEVVLNFEELDLDLVVMQVKYDQTMREKQNQFEKEDLSDMVVEYVVK